MSDASSRRLMISRMRRAWTTLPTSRPRTSAPTTLAFLARSATAQASATAVRVVVAQPHAQRPGGLARGRAQRRQRRGRVGPDHGPAVLEVRDQIAGIERAGHFLECLGAEEAESAAGVPGRSAESSGSLVMASDPYHRTSPDCQGRPAGADGQPL
jgi:hypothetical protein